MRRVNFGGVFSTKGVLRMKVGHVSTEKKRLNKMQDLFPSIGGLVERLNKAYI